MGLMLHCSRCSPALETASCQAAAPVKGLRACWPVLRQLGCPQMCLLVVACRGQGNAVHRSDVAWNGEEQPCVKLMELTARHLPV